MWALAPRPDVLPHYRQPSRERRPQQERHASKESRLRMTMRTGGRQEPGDDQPDCGIYCGTTYALRVRLSMAGGFRVRSYAAEAGFSSGKRTGADVGELQPLVDHSVPKYCHQPKN